MQQATDVLVVISCGGAARKNENGEKIFQCRKCIKRNNNNRNNSNNNNATKCFTRLIKRQEKRNTATRKQQQKQRAHQQQQRPTTNGATTTTLKMGLRARAATNTLSTTKTTSAAAATTKMSLNNNKLNNNHNKLKKVAAATITTTTTKTLPITAATSSATKQAKPTKVDTETTTTTVASSPASPTSPIAMQPNISNSNTEIEIEKTTRTTSSTTTTTKSYKAKATTTTYRSNSASALMAANGTTTAGSSSLLRPRTLNVLNLRETPTHCTQLFFGEVLNAWRAKARCNVVPAERTQELFHELSFHPSHKQISEMLKTAKMLARKGSRQSNGLTFGEFCVLAADLKRFRASTFSNASSTTNFCDKVQLLSSLQNEQTTESNHSTTTTTTAHNNDNNTNINCGTELRSTKSLSNVEDCKKKKTTPTNEPVEVFLGGSCNPTTWRADVAIPALQELGISFYNPQVSDWTPDLIELEHRAKEKARVLFFVMDSETRASAGAIEAAHIAGQNCKQLVLVLHPYRQNQSILNENISQQEYLDLMRNQIILKELVTRRGLPVLDNIPSGLQRTKDILAGIRDPPTKISEILIVVRGAFDRVEPVNDLLTIEQCQRALLYLGYAQSLLSLDNLNKVILHQREALKQLSSGCSSNQTQTEPTTTDRIEFDLFCVLSAYLSVLQQEIHESGCISPIKGTNVPPPPVYFTNTQDADIYFTSKNISRTSSNASVPSNGDIIERQSLNELLSRSRDSGTSSPQPLLEPLKSKSSAQIGKQHNNYHKPQIILNVESIETTEIITTKTIQTNNVNAAGGVNTTTTTNTQLQQQQQLPSSPLVHNNIEFSSIATAEEESDSNDSVFSSSSSINSVTNSTYSHTDGFNYNCLELRDVYLGGSCVLRTKWRQDIAMPYLKTKRVSFHLPALHESIPMIAAATTATSSASSSSSAATSIAADNIADNLLEEQQQQQRSFIRTRRKLRGSNNSAQLQLEEEQQEELTVAEESWSWSSLPPVVHRPNLYNPSLLDSSRVLLFVITNETRSLAPMTLAAHCIGLMYNVVLAVQMLPEDCVIGNEKLTPAAIKDYNRGRSYLIDLAKRQGVPVFNDIKAALACTVDKVNACNNRNRFD